MNRSFHPPLITFLMAALLLSACSPAATYPTLPTSQASPTATTIPPTPTQEPAPPLELYIDGAKVLLERSPLVQDSIVYLPGRELFEALGYETYIVLDSGNAYIGGIQIKPDRSTRKFHIEFGGLTGVIDPGLDTERFVEVAAPAFLEDGEGFLPLDFVAEHPGLTVNYDPASRRVVINTGRNLSSLSLQPGAPFNAVIFKHFKSAQLVDNRIGALASGLAMDNYEWAEGGESSHLSTSEQVNCGIKRWSITINNQDYYGSENWDVSEFEIDPRYRIFYEELTQQGMILTYNLIFKDKDFLRDGGVLGYPRFKNEAEIQRYLDYVRSTVRIFKGVVTYYEIWNEQNIQGTGQYIEPDDYLNLVRRVIPVIRDEDPAAKISVGQTTQFDDLESREYTYRILESDLMPVVDAVAIHAFFWDSPEYRSDFYYDYPTLLQDVKETAWAHGFTGEFIASEGNYTPKIPLDAQGRAPTYSILQAGTYAARGTVTNLGLGFSGGIYGITRSDGPAYGMICNLSTLFAGAQPQTMDITIQSSTNLVRQYGFSLPNGDRLLAIWTDGVVIENDPGITTQLSISGFPNAAVTAIDIMNNFEQEIAVFVRDGVLVINDLLIKDYPIILRLHPIN